MDYSNGSQKKKKKPTTRKPQNKNTIAERSMDSGSLFHKFSEGNTASIRNLARSYLFCHKSGFIMPMSTKLGILQLRIIE